MAERRDKRTFATVAVHSRARSQGELEAIVSLTPDAAWQLGAVRKGSRSENRHKQSGLRFESRCDEFAPPEDHIDDLLTRLAPARQQLRAFAEQAREVDPGTVAVQLRVVLESVKRELGFSVKSEQLRAISELGAEFLGVEVAFVDGEL